MVRKRASGRVRIKEVLVRKREREREGEKCKRTMDCEKLINNEKEREEKRMKEREKG